MPSTSKGLEEAALIFDPQWACSLLDAEGTQGAPQLGPTFFKADTRMLQHPLSLVERHCVHPSLPVLFPPVSFPGQKVTTIQLFIRHGFIDHHQDTVQVSTGLTV